MSIRSAHSILKLTLLAALAGCSGSKDDEVNVARDSGSRSPADERPDTDAEATPAANEEDAASPDGGLDAASEGDANASESRDGGTTESGEASLSDAATNAADGSAQDADAASPEASVGRQLYVSPTGSDSNDGSMEHPLQRISYAGTLAVAGDTIWLMDGTYDSTIDPPLGVGSAAPCGTGTAVPLANGVALRAVNPGAAIISVSGSHGFCVSGGELRDLDIRRPSQGGAVVESSSGSTLITNVKVTGAGAGGSGNEAAFIATGTAQLTIRPGGLTNLVGEPSYTYARVTGNAKVTLEGGVIDGADSTIFSGNAVFHALESGTLVLDGVTVTNSTKSRIVSTGANGTVELKNGTQLVCTNNTQGVYLGQGSPTLRVRDAKISGCTFAIGNVIYDTSNVTIDAQNMVLEANTTGIALGGSTSAITANVTLVGGALRANTQYGLHTNVPGTYTLTNTIVAGNNDRGLDFWNNANEYHVSLRGTTLRGNARSGLYMTGKAGSTLDLGTLASPGANILQGNNTSNTAQESSVRISLTAGDVVQAVGNTWDPNAQAADANGHYAATGAGQKVDVTSGTGSNYNVANATLRLAENP